jgi:predicted AAA+ superfamily ATPase
MEILRTKELGVLKARIKDFKVVAILGPRQCGKTTLARQFARSQPLGQVTWFDLENPADLAKLDQPMMALESVRGTVILDEIQRRPDLFPVLRVLVDRPESARYLVLGSASPDLLRQSSETLAGRITFMELGGFSIDSLPAGQVRRLWIRGGFPPSYLARSNQVSFQWRQDFITTFLERDIPNLGIRIPSPRLRRFWMMLSHYHGQIFNSSDVGRSLMVSDTAARHYLDVLTQTFVVRQVQPWFYNTRKRLVKRPKVYIRDSGLLHTLMDVTSYEDLHSHPRLGVSWEGFALEQVIQHLGLREHEVFFWAVHTGGELDMVFRRHGRLCGVELKYQDAPRMTPSMQSALAELELAYLWVVYPGKESYSLAKNVTVIPLTELAQIGG